MTHSKQQPTRSRIAIYKPRPFLLDVLLIFFCGVQADIFLTRRWGPSAWGMTFMLVAYAIFRFWEYCQFGVRGRPVVAFCQEALFFARPYAFSENLLVPLKDLDEVIVHGLPGERIFRLVRRDGTFQETRLSHGIRLLPGDELLEKMVIEFLERTLPKAIKLSVREPKPTTFFERVRGDQQ